MQRNPQSLVQAGNFLSTLYQTPSTITKREIITVNGVSEAQAFKLDKGESVALIDSNSDVLYIKEADEVGKVSLKIYECLDVTTEYLARNTPAQISKADFDNLTSQINNLTKLLGGSVNVAQKQQKE